MLTDDYREDEIQALIVLAELIDPVENPNNNSYAFPKNMAQAQTYFRRNALDLSGAFDSLYSKGFVRQEKDTWLLTPAGKDVADEIRWLRPPIYYWYRDFYTAIENSQAFSEYSRRVFGKNLGQHGFSDLKEIHKMLDLLGLDRSSQVLDIGCGNGGITEYISDLTQAFIIGIDYVPEAIAQAVKRTSDKRDRLNFRIANLEMLDFEAESFDAILSIDTIFFGREMKATLAGLKKILKLAGQMAIFYSSISGGDLPAALKDNNLSYETYNLSREHYEHMQLKHRVGSELRNAFEKEGNIFIWENIMRESISGSEPYDPAIHKTSRHLYIVRSIGLI